MPAATIVSSGGIPVTEVESGAPVLDIVTNGGFAITLTDNGAPFVLRGAAIPFSIPAMFSNGTFPVNLVQSDGTFSTNYDAANFRNTGTEYFVRAVGNDTTGDGTSGSPWRTIQKAVDTAATGSRINVGAGRFPPYTVTNKNLSFAGVSGQTFVGDFLTEADITWGTLTSGRQTATLASGTVSGFVDLTQLKRGYPRVSREATTAAGIATWQAEGEPGAFRSTPTQVGASNARDLAGSADTDLLIWKNTAAAPLTVTGTSQVFCENITFSGGAASKIQAGTRIVLHNCAMLGAHNQLIELNEATSVFKGGCFRHCSTANADVIDYGGATTLAVEIDIQADQGSRNGGAADNCSTCHQGKIMRVNGLYQDSRRPIHDNGETIAGLFGCRQEQSSGTAGIAIGDQLYSEAHVAGLTFANNGAAADFLNGTPGTTKLSRAYVYDDCLDNVTTSGAITDRTGIAPTDNRTFLALDPSNLATLFQDTAGTIPVTTAGQPVGRIVSPVNASDYATVAAGSLTYQVVSGKPCLRTGGSNNLAIAFFMDNQQIDSPCNIVIGLVSSDTNGILLRQAGTNWLGDYRGPGNLNGTLPSPVGFRAFTSATEYHVDGSPTLLTIGTQMQAAAFNGSPHVVAIHNADLSWVGWLRSSSFMWFFDGDLYGLEISRATNPAALQARVDAMAAKMVPTGSLI